MKKIIAFLYCFLLIMLNVKADDYDFSRLDYITAFAYSNNGNLIAAAEIAGNINIYNASTLEKIKTFNGKVLVTSRIIFSPDDRCVAVASYGIQVFEIETGNVLFEYLPGIGNHSRKIYSISYSFDGQRIVSGDRSGIVSIWDIKKGMETVTIDASGHHKSHNKSPIESVSFSPDGRSVLATTFSGLMIYDAENGNELHTLSEANIPFFMLSVLYSSDGRMIFLGYYKIRIGTIIEIYNADNFELLYSYTLTNIYHGVYGFYYVSNSSNIFIIARRNRLIIMDIYNGNIIKNIEFNLPIAVSPDGLNIVYSEDGVSVNLWNVY